jgi:CTP:molybdopterin cytidylyltransferase MocA
VHVLIFHATAPSDAGTLARALAEARRAIAECQLAAFLAAGADAAEIVAGPPDRLSFGERLATALRARGAESGMVGAVVVLGSGSIPLAHAADFRRFVDVAEGPGGHALANNRYSADVVAVSRAADLAGLPPLPADNALPRWLEERVGVAVRDLRQHWRLGVDVDTPLDLILLGDAALRRPRASAPLFGERLAAPLLGERLAELANVMSNRRAELLVAGRISASTLAWLERGVACRIRALVEERGLRAASSLAHSGTIGNRRPPRSVLGLLLDRDGPESLASTVAGLADASVIDTRVLIAHRAGADDSRWPESEDRYASDLLLLASIADPWLRALTVSATTAPSGGPILLGGHTLVNGGLRLIAERTRARAR